MWKVFQLSVVFAVMASNIHWQWTDNPTVAMFFAAAAAVWATLIVVKGGDLLRWLSARRFSSHDGLDDAGVGGVGRGCDHLVTEGRLNRLGHQSAGSDSRDNGRRSLPR